MSFTSKVNFSILGLNEIRCFLILVINNFRNLVAIINRRFITHRSLKGWKNRQSLGRANNWRNERWVVEVLISCLIMKRNLFQLQIEAFDDMGDKRNLKLCHTRGRFFRRFRFLWKLPSHVQKSLVRRFHNWMIAVIQDFHHVMGFGEGINKRAGLRIDLLPVQN